MLGFLEVPRVVRFIETEIRMEVVRARLWRNGKVVFSGHRVSAWSDERVLEVAGGDGCPTVWMYMLPLNCVLKNVWLVHFMFVLQFKN